MQVQRPRMTGVDMKRIAFTLVELLIVVVILGVLAAVVVPQFAGARSDSRLAALKANLRSIRGQIENYMVQHNGNYPKNIAQFERQMTEQTDADGASGTKFGPYLQSIPNNPFDNSNVIRPVLNGSGGWYYNKTTGDFRANDGGHDTL